MQEKKHLINNLCKRYINCSDCELGKKNNWSWPRGNVNSRWMICGEGPGRYEVLERRFFVGPAGQLLDKEFEKQGLKTNDFYVSNCTKCRNVAPRGSGKQNLTPTHKHTNKCKQWIDQEIEIINPDLIITVGATATSVLLDKSNVKMYQVQGKTITLDNRKYIPMYHPASVLHASGDRQQYTLAAIRTTISKIKELIKESN